MIVWNYAKRSAIDPYIGHLLWPHYHANPGMAYPFFPVARLPDMIADTIIEFIGLSWVDEVAFRGALDAHMTSTPTSRLQGLASAAFIGLLWGLWHLPIRMVGAHSGSALALITVDTAIGGIFLSFCWRRSRTLALSAFLHGFSNARTLSLMQ
jgi:hypothetical protein